MPRRKDPKSDSPSKPKAALSERPSVADRLDGLRKKAKDGETRLDDLQRVIEEMTEEMAAGIKNLHEAFVSLKRDVAALERRFQKLDTESVSGTRCDEIRNDIESRLNQLSAGSPGQNFFRHCHSHDLTP